MKFNPYIVQYDPEVDFFPQGFKNWLAKDNRMDSVDQSAPAAPIQVMEELSMIFLDCTDELAERIRSLPYVVSVVKDAKWELL